MTDQGQVRLLRAVVDAARGEYQVLAQLGHAPDRGSAYLARDLAEGGAAVLVAPPGGNVLDVVGALSDTVPAGGGRCTSCGWAPGTWTPACSRCERSLTPPAASGPAATAASTPAAAALAAAAGSAVQMLGLVPHAAGGHVAFGRDRVEPRLVAYAARPLANGGLWLDPMWEGMLLPAHLVQPSPAPADAPAGSASR